MTMKTAVVLKKVDDAMFAMVSSCSARVAVRADRCLGGQFLYAPMYYGIFSPSSMCKLMVGGCFLAMRKVLT